MHAFFVYPRGGAGMINDRGGGSFGGINRNSRFLSLRNKIDKLGIGGRKWRRIPGCEARDNRFVLSRSKLRR